MSAELAAGGRARAFVPPWWLPALLGLLTAVGPLSTDMYLPAFPAIERSLGSGAGSAQLTLATWFAGLAVGQITQGTLADRYGRRVPLLLGTVLYTLASAGCALAPGLFSLCAFRALAAFGGSASMVVPRAVVRDLADGHEAARLMARLMLIMGAVPILAPTLGGFVLGIGGWRLIFWIATAYGLICLVMVLAFLPDTLPRQARIRLPVVALIARYIGILRERAFLTHTLQGGWSMFALFAFLGGSPPVFIDLFHLSPTGFGLVFMLNASGYIFCSQVSARLLPRFGMSSVLRGAALVFLAATMILTFDAITGFGGMVGIIAPVFVTMSSLGFVMPTAAVGALSRHAAHAGSASAVMGTLQFVLGALSGTLIGLLSDGTALPMAGMMLLGAVAANVADRLRPVLMPVLRPAQARSSPATGSE